MFQYGLETLIAWKAAVFYEKSEMMLDETKKKGVYGDIGRWTSIGETRNFGRD